MEDRKLNEHGDYGFKYPRKKFQDGVVSPWYDAIIFRDSNRTCRVGFILDSGYYFQKNGRIYETKKEFEEAVRKYYK